MPEDAPDNSTQPSALGSDPAVFVEVEDSAVGCVGIGAPLEIVRRDCVRVRDTTIYLEGMAQAAAIVDVGAANVTAEVVDGAVWRIRVEDVTLRTADSLGVGTPMSRMADLPGIQIVHGEGTFARTAAHCGKTFRVGGVPFRQEGWAPEQLAVLPDSARVDMILILGRCDHR